MIPLMHYSVSTGIRMHVHYSVQPSYHFSFEWPILQIATCNLSFASLLLVVNVILCKISEFFNVHVPVIIYREEL